MHMLPLFYRDDSSEYYNCPTALTTPERHQIYTKDFDSIGMYLGTSHIIYYGSDKENRKPEIINLAYSTEKGYYDCKAEAQGLPREVFQKEIEKDVLFLKKSSVTHKRTCKAVTFQVLVCIMVVLSVSVP